MNSTSTFYLFTALLICTLVGVIIHLLNREPRTPENFDEDLAKLNSQVNNLKIELTAKNKIVLDQKNLIIDQKTLIEKFEKAKPEVASIRVKKENNLTKWLKKR